MISGTLFKKENLWLISYTESKEDIVAIREIQLHPDFIIKMETLCDYWNGTKILFDPVWLKDDNSGVWYALPLFF
jgi:hypothetical protein